MLLPPHTREHDILQPELGGSDVNARVTLNGTEYTSLGEGTPSRLNLTTVGFSTGTFEIPPLGAETSLTAPFSFGGSFSSRVFGVPGEPNGILTLASASFSGRGTSTMFLISTPAGTPTTWLVRRIEFDFEDPTPVPEPSTMLLTGLGVAVLGRRVRTRAASRS